MARHEYPSHIQYFGQKMKSRISLKPEFKNERKAMRYLPESDANNVYLDKEKQKKHTIQWLDEENLAVDRKGLILSGEYTFILTCEEEPKLICSANLHHSYMANGKKILASGSLTFERGKLVKISNNSGHYRPTDDEMLDAIKALYIASGGSLKTYKSFSTTEQHVYSVKQLFAVEHFNEVSPLSEEESPNLSEVIDSGYDIVIASKNTKVPQDNSRYGKGLKQELELLYGKIITKYSALYAPIKTHDSVDAGQSPINTPG
ncbi:hypothetical protein [Legionella waltersii]|uniref:Uncharacterized protein n=1 Tax=Legionella waltersii TaxID=66969 RepID=A0A0W1AK73_9GAMM|nr:hypothetical protein [Legionella waltersii]KTD81757.1 hypothetical protein Lwal_1009 [Legionella waltersii]SNU97117.1 Uncharacterised protein [Legionella waltersii]